MMVEQDLGHPNSNEKLLNSHRQGSDLSDLPSKEFYSCIIKNELERANS